MIRVLFVTSVLALFSAVNVNHAFADQLQEDIGRCVATTSNCTHECGLMAGIMENPYPPPSWGEEFEVGCMHGCEEGGIQCEFDATNRDRLEQERRLNR
jgi:hypothetical protein